MTGPDVDRVVSKLPETAPLVIGLTASDVGRPITRLRLKLVDAGDLEETMLNVIAEVRPSHQRLLDPEGWWCELRVSPYQTSDNRIDGVVLSVLATEDLNHADAITPGRWWWRSPQEGESETQREEGKTPLGNVRQHSKASRE